MDSSEDQEDGDGGAARGRWRRSRIWRSSNSSGSSGSRIALLFLCFPLDGGDCGLGGGAPEVGGTHDGRRRGEAVVVGRARAVKKRRGERQAERDRERERERESSAATLLFFLSMMKSWVKGARKKQVLTKSRSFPESREEKRRGEVKREKSPVAREQDRRWSSRKRGGKKTSKPRKN